MLSKLKKLLFFLSAGTYTLLLSACYGVMAETPFEKALEKDINAKDASSNPIPGLRVQYYKNDSLYSQAVTDTNGNASIHILINNSSETNKFVIDDIDGTNNLGSFQSVTTNVNNSSDETINVTMQTN